MATGSRLAVLSGMLVAHAMTASAQPGATEPSTESTTATEQLEQDTDVRAPGTVEVQAEVSPTRPVRPVHDPLATTQRWGGGVRLTGLSGIGALPGVNYGGELAALVRHDEFFGELALGRWKPEKTYVVAETPEHVELGLDVWTVRAGWWSMKMPLRGWVLGEVGELANARQMPGVVARMMTGETPMERRWKALGGGFGVAWPMTENARLIGMVELAIPVNRQSVTLDSGAYQSDPLAARSSVGLELGWR